MRNTLLWVYEGQTEFWGEVLTARSGLRSAAEARESLATSAAWLLEGRPGRAWRTLQDTTNEALLTPDRWQRDWRSWQRGQDYYDEMTLVWIEADALIREGSQGARSLDDFARDFFGAQPGRDARELGPLPYTFDDVVRELGRVQPYDWAAFLRQRLDGHDGSLLAAGLRRAGWQLAWSEQQSDFDKNADAAAKSTDFWFSLGFSVGEEGKLEGVRWDSPAFQAGLTKGQNLLAVNSRAYKAEILREAITAAKTNARPIELLFKSGDLYRSVAIDYRGGLRYPKLERVDGSADQLGALLAPR